MAQNTFQIQRLIMNRLSAIETESEVPYDAAADAEMEKQNQEEMKAADQEEAEMDQSSGENTGNQIVQPAPSAQTKNGNIETFDNADENYHDDNLRNDVREKERLDEDVHQSQKENEKLREAR